MARPGAQGFEVYIQNSAPIAPSPGDFWFDTSGATVLNFRTPFGNWLAIDIPTAALDTLSNSVSVLSNAVSVISQNISVLSNAVSVISQSMSALSNAQSVLSQAVSVLSQSVSVLSNSVSVLSNAVSVISNQVSVLSQAVSVISQQVSVLSVQVVSVISLHNALSQVVSVISVTLSALSTAVSIISVGLGGVQMKVVANIQGVSSTAAAGIAVSGLSVSVAAAGIYQVDGVIMYRMSAVDALGFNLNFPAMVFAAGRFTGTNLNAQLTSVVVGTFDENGSNSIILSLITSSTSTYIAKLDGIFNVSTAGTIQVQARVSATTNPANIQAGSYIRAYKLA